MTTIVTTVKNAIAPAGAPVLQLPTPEEMALLQSPNLQEWWRPDSGYNVNDKWIGKKNGIALVRNDSGGWPDVATGVNGKPYMYRQTGVGKFVVLKPESGANVHFPIPPSRGYTFVWVGKPILFDRPANNAIFTPVADTQANAGFIGYDDTARRIYVRHRGAAHINYGIVTPDDNHYFIASFDYETQSGVLYMDGVQVASGSTAVIPFSDGLSIFSSLTSTGTALGNASFSGHIYDLLPYNDALHMSRNADQLTTLLNYCSVRYGL